MSQAKRQKFTPPAAFASQGSSRVAGESAMTRVSRKTKSKPKYTKAQREKYERSLLYKIARNIDMSSHYYDLESGNSSVTGAGAVHNLNPGTAITAGDGVNNRNGDSIYMKHLSLRYTMFNQLTFLQTGVWKIWVILEKHPDGSATPGASDIFEAPDGVWTQSPILQPRLWETMRDYKILASATHVVKPNTVGDNAGSYLTTQSGEPYDYGEMSIPLNFTTKYDASGNTEDGRLLVVIRNNSDTAVSGVATGGWRFYSRVTFAP